MGRLSFQAFILPQYKKASKPKYINSTQLETQLVSDDDAHVQHSAGIDQDPWCEKKPIEALRSVCLTTWATFRSMVIQEKETVKPSQHHHASAESHIFLYVHTPQHLPMAASTQVYVTIHISTRYSIFFFLAHSKYFLVKHVRLKICIVPIWLF